MLKLELRLQYLWLFVLIAAPAPGWAADLAGDLNQCAAIKRDRTRLACFDRAVAGLATPSAESEGTAPDAVPAIAPESPPAAPVEQADPPRTASGAAPIVESTVQGKEEELFGFESQVQTTTPDEVRSRYMGEFTGWSGRTLFRLENGQVWKQTDNSRLVWNASNPVVTIRKGAFGTFRLGVEGVNKTVKVKRVK